MGLREDSTLPGSDSLCKSKSLLGGRGHLMLSQGPLPLETGGRWEEGVVKGQAASRVRGALLGRTAWGAVRPRPALLSWVQPKVREGSGPGPAHGRLQAPVPQHSRDIPMDKGGTGWSNTAEELGEKGEAGDHSCSHDLACWVVPTAKLSPSVPDLGQFWVSRTWPWPTFAGRQGALEVMSPPCRQLVA